jgi:hypothetical protein
VQADLVNLPLPSSVTVIPVGEIATLTARAIAFIGKEGSDQSQLPNEYSQIFFEHQKQVEYAV